MIKIRKIASTSNSGADVKKLGFSYTADQSVKGCNRSEREFGSFLKKLKHTYPTIQKNHTSHIYLREVKLIFT